MKILIYLTLFFSSIILAEEVKDSSAKGPLKILKVSPSIHIYYESVENGEYKNALLVTKENGKSNFIFAEKITIKEDKESVTVTLSFAYINSGGNRMITKELTVPLKKR